MWQVCGRDPVVCPRDRDVRPKGLGIMGDARVGSRRAGPRSERVETAGYHTHPEDPSPICGRERTTGRKPSGQRRRGCGQWAQTVSEPVPLTCGQVTEEGEGDVPPLGSDPGQTWVSGAQRRPLPSHRRQYASRWYDGDKPPQRQGFFGGFGLAGFAGGGVAGGVVGGGVVAGGGVVPGGGGGVGGTVPGGTGTGATPQMVWCSGW